MDRARKDKLANDLKFYASEFDKLADSLDSVSNLEQAVTNVLPRRELKRLVKEMKAVGA